MQSPSEDRHRRRRRILMQIAAAHLRDTRDRYLATLLRGEKPLQRFAAVTSAITISSACLAEAELLFAADEEEMSHLLSVQARGDRLSCGRVWDLDGRWNIVGNLAVAHEVKVGRILPRPIHAVEVEGRGEDLYLFTRPEDADRFRAVLRRSGEVCRQRSATPLGARATYLLIQKELGID